MVSAKHHQMTPEVLASVNGYGEVLSAAGGAGVLGGGALFHVSSHGVSHLKGIGQANLYRVSAFRSNCEERGWTPRGAGTGGDSASTNNAPNNGYRLKYRLSQSAPRWEQVGSIS